MPSRPPPTLFRTLTVATLLLTIVPTAHAQLAHKGPAAAIALAKTLPPYDVVSIHQNKSAGAGSWGIRFGDTTITATNVTLQFVLQVVYDVKANQITGLTGSVASQHFDLTAKVLPAADGTQPKRTDSQLIAMMIPLLADRFHLQAHLESRISPVYDLVVAKSGIKLKLEQSERTDGGWNNNFAGAEKTLTAKSFSMEDLADALSDMTDRKVIDKTGLTGHADITLKWSEDLAAEQGDPNNISIFTAIEEQLGLKLQPAKGPVDTLVIDHVELPSEN
jgi:bla regulator protein blaR1